MNDLDKVRETLIELQKQVVDAQAELNAATDAARVASRLETDLINKCNNLQKQFDAAVGTFRGLAPNGTDWRRPKRRPTE